MESINKKAMEDELYNLLYMLDCPEDVCNKYNLQETQYAFFMIGYIRNSIMYMLDENYCYKLIREIGELKRVNAVTSPENAESGLRRLASERNSKSEKND